MDFEIVASSAIKMVPGKAEIKGNLDKIHQKKGKLILTGSDAEVEKIDNNDGACMADAVGYTNRRRYVDFGEFQCRTICQILLISINKTFSYVRKKAKDVRRVPLRRNLAPKRPALVAQGIMNVWNSVKHS